MQEERRQSCMAHSQQIGELKADVKGLRRDFGEMKISLDAYMAAGHKKRAEVDMNTAFRKVGMWVCAGIGAIVGWFVKP